MRKRFLILLVGLAWFWVGTGAVFADGMVLPVPEASGPGYLAVRYHHVKVHIENGHAVTRVEQEFYNPYSVPVQGRYLFPVPPDAILSRFQALVDGHRQKAVEQDAATTNDALHASVVQQHDPSLLQYADWVSLAFDFDLPPGGSRKVDLEYEEVLVPTGGLYRYRYVLSTERYSSLPVEEVSVVADIQSTSGLTSMYCPSHPVRTELQGAGRARVAWAARDVNPNEDFQLFFAPARQGYGGGLLTGQRNDQDHLLFLFSPEAALPQTETLPKDIVFVVDRSGSMGGEKIQQARDALRLILGQLGEDDRFSIVGFNERLVCLSEVLRPEGDDTIQEARRFVDRLNAEGSTDLEAALQAGLNILAHSENRGAVRMLLFLTDGLPTAGIVQDQVIVTRVTGTNAQLEARLHVFGVGYDVNTHLLDRLAADNSGTVTYILPGDDLELALTGFYGKIARPLLTDIEVEFDGLEADHLYPESLPDLFQGSSLLLTGRYRATARNVSVRVRGWAGDTRREYVYSFDLEETGGRDFVPWLWATRRVGALLNRVRVEGEEAWLTDEIRELGLSYGIVTPYTTFVVEGQVDGAASAESMALYRRADLNAVSGETAIEARVQNQRYQGAAQANLAVGANVSNAGQRSLAQVGLQQMDLSLLQGSEYQDLNGPITEEWIESNIQVDHTVEFGSEAYFALAADPAVRAILQGGSNISFAYEGQIVAVRDVATRDDRASSQSEAAERGPQGPAWPSTVLYVCGAMRVARVVSWLLPFAAVAVLLGLIAWVLVVRGARKQRAE